ncbi:MAG: hypothetical protein ACRETG_00270 [Steroidobacteraceae bacterium]
MIVPETVAPFAGAVIETVGGVVSGGGFEPVLDAEPPPHPVQIAIVARLRKMRTGLACMMTRRYMDPTRRWYTIRRT